MTAPRPLALAARARRLLAPLLLAAAAAVATPSAARAHAHLERSVPAAGASVVGPSAIRLWFTETPELALTRVILLDARGAQVALDAPEREPDGAMGIRARIPRPLAPGRYTVRWSTAAADGHPSKGSFTFVVDASSAAPAVSSTDSLTGTAPAGPAVQGPAPRPTETNPGEPSAEMDPTEPLAVVTRAIWLSAMVVLLGAVAFRLLVLRRAAVFDEEGHEVASTWLADWALLVCAVFLAAAVVRLYLQTTAMSDRLSSSTSPLLALLLHTRWGSAWRMQFAAGVVALLGLLVARRRFAVGWGVAAFAGVMIAVAVAASGHAAAGRLASLAVADDALHVLGASGWLGTLFWVVVVGTISIRTVRHEPARRVAMLVHSFSPVALSCAALVASTGVASAWLRLGSLPALMTTSYGRVLMLKLLLVAAAGAFGFYNWRRLRPSLGTDPAAARLRRSATTELIIGAAIVLATALLVGLPAPASGPR